MSVLLETSLGDIVIDLYFEECPRTCLNFLKLCKTKYYNFTPFHNVQSGFLVQTGDPLGSGKGGESIWGVLKGSRYKYFPAEVHPRLKHEAVGTVSMAVATDPQHDLSVADVDWSQVVDSYMADSQGRAAEGPLCGSQFLITTGPQLDYLDGKYAVFGYVAEGLDVLERIDRVHCDETGRPFQDIRIRHTIILDDPFPDPEGLTVPDRSPLPTQAQLATVRIADYEEIKDPDEQDESAREKTQREREAETQALTLEMIGDLPHAEIRPPENVLFVCKLNPVTSDEDLEMIFSRFGTIISCQVIRDRKTEASLGYAFIEFARKEECEQAYFKMDNVLIDDRRIKVGADPQGSTTAIVNARHDELSAVKVGGLRTTVDIAPGVLRALPEGTMADIGHLLVGVHGEGTGAMKPIDSGGDGRTLVSNMNFLSMLKAIYSFVIAS
ncbi:Peptidyl-prolyl cis-trans isomerase-like 4 [Dispira parvispora]|uniref:Peptidyl-prolyl cis-trans isomerase n=1 Tax=Dispira parvispora TaxID=1520584 RepID=A0A9W8AU32_9FUNG|nr:Peptidyl-prolyl cis-trans isomerase-like 4 [Dispira parvispora]